MKNKKSIYILLTVVIIIWGLLIYKFFSFTNPSTEMNSGQTPVTAITIKENVIDTFTIDVNYRDPFLGKMYVPAGQAKKTTYKRSIKKEPVNWPSIIYKGLVSDNNEKQKVFMVVINGKNFLMHENDKEEEVELKDGNRDFITVKYKKSQTKIFINE